MATVTDQDTITVTIPDREEQSRTWGQPGGGFLRTVTLTLPRFTEQGERRSDPWEERLVDDGEFYYVSRWTLDSGRIEKYGDVIRAARAKGEL
jgi:hypothetical protein